MATIADAKGRKPFVPGCWTDREIAAAKVNDLDIKMDVGALRCRSVDVHIEQQFTAFKRVTASVIAEAGDVVQAHFGGNPLLYDHYAIKVANKYGAGRPDETCDQVAALIKAGIRQGSTFDGLAGVAAEANINPIVDGEPCRRVVAQP